MTRNFKSFGLAFVAAFAMLALAASEASAEEFHSEADHTIITGTQGVTNTFTVNAGTAHCQTATFEGTISATTTSQITIAPNYAKCKITNFGPETVEATVDTNGCHYLATASGQVHITCPGEPIKITAPLCTITVHPQTVESVDYKNLGAGTTREVRVTSTATGINYTQSSLCPSGGGEFSNGTYAGTVLSTGEDRKQKHIGIWYE